MSLKRCDDKGEREQTCINIELYINEFYKVFWTTSTYDDAQVARIHLTRTTSKKLLRNYWERKIK